MTANRHGDLAERGNAVMPAQEPGGELPMCLTDVIGPARAPGCGR